MKLQKISCPNCDGILDMRIDNQTEFIFCPYCGQQIYVDGNKREFTFNKNIKINKNITYTNRNIDDAEVIKAKTDAKEKKVALILYVVVMALLIGGLIISFIIKDFNAKKAQKAGKIQAGSCEDYEGEHYEAVIKQLEALGFTNITIVDLNDAGIVLWKNEKVESVSIGGDTTFYNTDYFEPTENVIVKYH